MADEVKCPKCSSTQITASKKGFSAAKAVGGAVLTGGIGLAAGFHGSGKVEVLCIACGHKWNPQQLAKQKSDEKNQQQIADYTKWKRSFYSAYDKNDFELAESIFLQKNKFYSQIPDVHTAYKKSKSADNQVVVFGIVVFIVIMAILFWLAF